MLNVLVIQVNVVRLLVVHHLEVQLVTDSGLACGGDGGDGVVVVVISKIPLHVSARYALFCKHNVRDQF